MSLLDDLYNTEQMTNTEISEKFQNHKLVNDKLDIVIDSILEFSSLSS